MFRNSRLGRLARRIAGGVLLPHHHARVSGQWRSAWAAKPVAADGRTLPWYTRPFVDMLDRRDYRDKRILEFGGGFSTAFWCERGAQVATLEADADWFSRIGALVQPHKPRLYLIDEPLEQFPDELMSEQFDLVVVDGLDRCRAAEIARELVAPSGAIIVDNSEGSWAKTSENDFPIMETLGHPAFQRVDFYGHGLGVFKPSCTSVFFRDACFLFDQRDRPRFDR